MTRDVATFIFDLDGVLTDTSEYHYLAWERLADQEHVEFDRRTNEKLWGVSRRDSLRILLGETEASEAEMLEMMARKNGYYIEYIKKITPGSLYPGVKKLLGELRDREIKIGLASASRNARSVINSLQIEEYFDAVSGGNSIERSKPAPDIFLHNANSMDLKPTACAVVEDAEAGIEAALAANMIAIGIGPFERIGGAHFRYDHVGEIQIDQILAWNEMEKDGNHGRS